ncbi:hypothetical protein BJ546DRAFT_101012 [Cryomyces antarcticus]
MSAVCVPPSRCCCALDGSTAPQVLPLCYQNSVPGDGHTNNMSGPEFIGHRSLHHSAPVKHGLHALTQGSGSSSLRLRAGDDRSPSLVLHNVYQVVTAEGMTNPDEAFRIMCHGSTIAAGPMKLHKPGFAPQNHRRGRGRGMNRTWSAETETSIITRYGVRCTVYVVPCARAPAVAPITTRTRE